jgi:hypothetical protein
MPNDIWHMDGGGGGSGGGGAAGLGPRHDFVAEAGASRNPVGSSGHGNFLSGLKLSGERESGLGLARFSVVCPLGGHMYEKCLLRHTGMAGAACMGLTTEN